jgi:hypothetical protein
MRLGATECFSCSLLLTPPVVPRCSSSFLVLPAPTSRFRALVLGPNDGRASFDVILCLPRSVLWTPRHLLRPCHAFFHIPFDLVNICASLASRCRDSLQSSILISNIMSQSLKVSCLLRKTPFCHFPCLSNFLSYFFTPPSSSRPLPFPSGHYQWGQVLGCFDYVPEVLKGTKVHTYKYVRAVCIEALYGIYVYTVTS